VEDSLCFGNFRRLKTNQKLEVIWKERQGYFAAKNRDNEVIYPG
jgi:hypothetical protein